MRTIIALLKFLRPFVGEVVLSCVLGIAAVAAGIGLLGTSAYLIASAALHPSIAELQVAIVGVRFFGISRAVFRYLERLVSHSVNLRVLARLRQWFYDQIELTPPFEMFTYRSGDLLNRIMGNLETLDNFYVRVVSPLVVALTMGVASSLFLGGYAPKLGILLACGLFVNGILTPAAAILATRVTSVQMADQRTTLSAQTVEYLQGLEDLQANGADNRWMMHILQSDHKAGEQQKRVSLFNGLATATSLFWLNIVTLSLVWISIPLVSQNELSGVSLAVILMVGMASFEAVGNLPQAAVMLTASLDAAKQVFALTRKGNLTHGLAPSSLTPPTPMGLKPSTVKVAHLSFEHAGDESFALRDISFSLERGKKLALFGPSGSGKTSIINLLLRLWPVENGRIHLDDVDTRTLDAYQVRTSFAVISQNTWLFSATLRDNFLLADPQASDQSLIDAVKLAELTDWVGSLPRGLDTWLGDQGNQISGGERQRVAIARALLQNRPFLILDEAVEHLDKVTADKVQNNIFDLFSDRGLLVVTHDPGVLDRMDEIILLEHGRTMSRGNFDLLMSSNQHFARMMQSYSLQK